jgi:hypothetical protein
MLFAIGNNGTPSIAWTLQVHPAPSIDTTPPSIAIANIAGDNIVSATEANSGFTIGGSTVGAESGQTVTVKILNGSSTVVDSYTTSVANNAWSVNVTQTQATALADGNYTVRRSMLSKDITCCS